MLTLNVSLGFFYNGYIDTLYTTVNTFEKDKGN